MSPWAPKRGFDHLWNTSRHTHCLTLITLHSSPSLFCNDHPSCCLGLLFGASWQPCLDGHVAHTNAHAHGYSFHSELHVTATLPRAVFLHITMWCSITTVVRVSAQPTTLTPSLCVCSLARDFSKYNSHVPLRTRHVSMQLNTMVEITNTDSDPEVLRVGDTVQLDASAAPVTPLCLERGETGVIIAKDDSPVPYRVRGPRGDTHWYATARLSIVAVSTFILSSAEDQWLRNCCTYQRITVLPPPPLPPPPLPPP